MKIREEKRLAAEILGVYLFNGKKLDKRRNETAYKKKLRTMQL